MISGIGVHCDSEACEGIRLSGVDKMTRTGQVLSEFVILDRIWRSLGLVSACRRFADRRAGRAIWLFTITTL
jgi:hypothetical protein